VKKQWIVTQEDHQLRIDDFAYKHNITRKALKAIKLKGDILVDGCHCTVRYQVHKGERITFIFPEEQSQIQPVFIDFPIVYEDQDILVIDKPPNIPCIPTKAYPDYTLAHGIMYYYQSIGLSATVHLVNRLDRQTKGLMIVAKSGHIHHLMSRKHIYRVYRAHVEGIVSEGIIDLPIYKQDYQMKRIIDKKGKPSITYYQAMRYEKNCTYVACRLQTGRTHQIRVHMSAIGHPLIGDKLYGHEDGMFDLESYCLCFQHPVTQQIIYIEKKGSR
jgi:23S rRNA pseudouridine1911/1915/1917 synthase